MVAKQKDPVLLLKSYCCLQLPKKPRTDNQSSTKPSENYLFMRLLLTCAEYWTLHLPVIRISNSSPKNVHINLVFIFALAI
jgi:hypothetical protein